MTTYESPVFTCGAASLPTDAEFRIWGEACETALDALLTPQSSTTDWATVTLPTTAGSGASGEAVYTLDDGITPELWLKFQWGRAHNSASEYRGQFMLLCTMALDSTFSNVLSGYCTDRPPSPTTDVQWIGAKGEGYFHLSCMSSYTTMAPCTVVVERARDADLTVRTDEAMIGLSGMKVNSLSSSTYTVGGLSIGRWQFSPSVKDSALAVTGRTTVVDPTTVNVGAAVNPVFPMLWPGQASGCLYPMASVAVARSSVVPAYQNLDVEVSGVDVPFRSGATPQALTGISGAYPLYRWQ